jgi:hypothetical protein
MFLMVNVRDIDHQKRLLNLQSRHIGSTLDIEKVTR